jgi:hypothetical protein
MPTPPFPFTTHLTNLRFLWALLPIAALSAASLGQTWVNQGPGPLLGGQVEGMELQANPVSGAVRVVLPHPTDANTLYLGTVNGGVWKSHNALSLSPSWTPLTDFAPSLSIGALVFDTADPTHQTLVAGFGRFSSLALTGGARIGLLRTTDGGQTWAQVGATALADRNVTAVEARGSVIIVSANTGTQPGMYRSTDTGETFSYISGAPTSGLPFGPIAAMKGDPGNIARFYCVVLGGAGGVYRSNDFGTTWTDITNGISGLSDADNAKIAIHHSDAGNAVYVSVDFGGQLESVYRSPDLGLNWTDLARPEVFDGVCTIGVNPGRQGNIHMSLGVDRNNPNIVYVGGDRQATRPCDFGTFPNALGAENYSVAIFRGNASLPEALRWQSLTHIGTNNNSSPHADSRSLAMDAAGNLLEGDDGGVYRRVNPNSSNGDWFSVNGDLCVGEFHSAAWDHNAKVVFGGTQDVGTAEQVMPGSPVWETVSGGDGGKVAVEAQLDGTSYRYSSFQYLGGFRRRLVDSNNSVLELVFPDLTVEGTDPPRRLTQVDNPQFYSPIATNNVFGPGLAIITNRRVFVSYNRGATVRDLGDRGGNPTCIVFGGRRNGEDFPHVVWVGATGNRIFFKQGLDDDLVQITNFPGAVNTIPRALAVKPDDYGTLLVCENSRVFLTRNIGQTWQEITGDLVDAALRGAEYLPDPINGDKFLVGGNNGVFSTPANNPGVWTPYGEGLPKAPVREIRYNPVDNLLVIATLGRGIWTLDIPSAPPCIGDFNQDGGVDGADVEAFYLAWEAADESADVNQDGGVDGADVEAFFIAWEAGC